MRASTGIHTVIAQFAFIEYATCALMGYICYPDAADPETQVLCSLE